MGDVNFILPRAGEIGFIALELVLRLNYNISQFDFSRYYVSEFVLTTYLHPQKWALVFIVDPFT
jgi:hypothetical protein